MLEVARRVHALPVAVVSIHLELAVLRQALERLPFEYAAVLGRQVLEDLPVHHEEAAVDVAGRRRRRLLAELDDARAARQQLAEPRRRPDAGHGREAPVLTMEREQ